MASSAAGGGPDGGQRSDGGGGGASEGEEAAATMSAGHLAGCSALLEKESDADSSIGPAAVAAADSSRSE